ncbi:MAG: isocitrate/isopropylmalate dehydrogenase family protein [Candidatus Nanoarchaeia archaeon]
MEKTIAILPGDGIGPEITLEAIKVLRAVENKYNHKFKLIAGDFGANSYFKNKDSFPKDCRELCMKADSVLKGPIGLGLNQMKKIPTEFGAEKALTDLRQMLDSYANYRPVYLPKALAEFSPLKPEIIKDGIDIMILRELVGGIYFGEKIESKQTNQEYASDLCKYTKEQVKRFAHAAFKEASKKSGRLTSVHKSNILATSRFWNEIFLDASKMYPEVEFKTMLVDNCAYQLVINPTQFNGVMALENMQGDILSDQAGGIIGSLGLMPSACLNIQTRKGYYEPSHGSAPDIAGKNIANPYSMIGSLALMLDKSFGLEKESKDAFSAMEKVFLDGYRTRDLTRQNTPLEKIVSTSRFGDLVVEKIKNQ